MSSVLITGTSKGIGFETALVMARAGHTVYATMRNPGASTRLQEIAERESLPITVSAMDVDSDTSVRDAFEKIHASGVNIDVLVNNAGIERNGSIEELSFEDFRAVMETNYFGVIRCIKAVIPRMRERKNGVHHQRRIGGRPHRKLALELLRGFEARVGSTERVPRAGDAAVQRPGGHH